jgi:hypothetical protein
LSSVDLSTIGIDGLYEKEILTLFSLSIQVWVLLVEVCPKAIKLAPFDNRTLLAIKRINTMNIIKAQAEDIHERPVLSTLVVGIPRELIFVLTNLYLL